MEEEEEEEGTDLSPTVDSNVVLFDDDDAVGLGDLSSTSEISGVIDISSSNR